MTALFRREAVEARRPGLEGQVVIVRPPQLIFFSAFAATILVAVGSFAGFAEFTNRTPVLGSVVPRIGVQRVFSPTSGVVSEKLFEDGQAVRKGQPLYTVIAERYTGHHQGVEALVTGFAESRRKSVSLELSGVDALETAERRSLDSSIRELERQLGTIDQQIRRQKSRVAIAADGRARYRALLPQGYVTTDQVQDREATYLDQVTALDALEREKSTVSKDMQIAQSDLAALGAKYRSQREQLTRTYVAAEQDIVESGARREIHILSPVDGIASGVTLAIGEAVDTAKPLLTVVPDNGDLIAELYVPRSAIGFIRQGADVYLRYDAFPYQKFGLQPGKVRSISTTAIPTADLAVAFGGVPRREIDNPLESYYRLTVELPSSTVHAYGEPRALKPGMTLTADVELETKRIYEWLLDPVISSKGRVSFF